jgi:hypothetical protein
MGQQRSDILGCHLSFGHGYNQVFLQKNQPDEVKKPLNHGELTGVKRNDE